MDIIWSGRLIGTFYGYTPGRIYKLSDGSKWTQADLTDEPACRDDPTASLVANGSGAIYLDVEGTFAVVQVYRTRGWAGGEGRGARDRSEADRLPHRMRNRELFLGAADMCIAVHNRIAACSRTLDSVRQALQGEIPTYGIENVHASPKRIKRGTKLR
jgi:hypothetical protein